MSNRPSPWAVKSHEQRQISSGVAPIISFRPEAQSFKPPEDFDTSSMDGKCTTESFDEQAQEPPDHYLPSHGFKSPAITDHAVDMNSASHLEVLDYSNKMASGSIVSPKEYTHPTTSFWCGSSKISSAAPLAHARAYSDSKNVFNVHSGGILRPRSRSDCPMPDKTTEKSIHVLSLPTDRANMESGVSDTPNFSPCSPHNVSSSSSRSPGSQNMASVQANRRQLTYNPLTSRHETISESPEFHSNLSYRYRSNLESQESQRQPGLMGSKNYDRLGSSRAWPSSTSREMGDVPRQRSLGYQAPHQMDVSSQLRHPCDIESRPESTPISANSSEVLPGYTARQLVDMIKCGLAESPQHMQSADSDARQANIPSRNSALTSFEVPRLNAHYQPSAGSSAMHQALEGLPLDMVGFKSNPATHGVIRICDIPYNTLRAEVVAFLGRNARLVEQPPGTPYFAVHIIMERQTAKSMDCFVELQSPQDAFYAVSRFDRGNQDGKRPRIGDRAVTVKMSSQEALMMELFPRAKCVTWKGQQPVVVAANDPFSSGFQGFITNEELVMTNKYAENPNRSRFAAKHPQRAYESMITLLAKYPWWETSHVTLRERDNIFNATVLLIATLRNHLRRGNVMAPLTPMLLEELAIAGLNCPGFSEPQRATLIDNWAEFATNVPFVTELAPVWPFETLRRQANVPESMIMHFATVIKKGVISLKPSVTATPWTQMQTEAPERTADFGGYTTSIQLGSHGDKSQMTLDYVAQLELYYLLNLIHHQI